MNHVVFILFTGFRTGSGRSGCLQKCHRYNMSDLACVARRPHRRPQRRRRAARRARARRRAARAASVVYKTCVLHGSLYLLHLCLNMFSLLLHLLQVVFVFDGWEGGLVRRGLGGHGLSGACGAPGSTACLKGAKWVPRNGGRN